MSRTGESDGSELVRVSRLKHLLRSFRGVPKSDGRAAVEVESEGKNAQYVRLFPSKSSFWYLEGPASLLSRIRPIRDVPQWCWD